MGDAPSGGGSDATPGDGNPGGDAPNGGNPTTITVTLANEPNSPSTFSFLAAYQDGAGAWQLAPSPTNDTYTFAVSSSSWAFAWTCVTAGAATREVNVYEFAVSDTTSLTIGVPARCTDRSPTAVALNGTISNPPVGGTLQVGFGRTTVAAANGATTTYAMMPFPATRDLIVGHSAATNLNGDLVTDQAAIQRSVVVSGATTTDNVDFSTAQSTQSATVTVATSAGQSARVTTTLYSAGGTVYTMVDQATGPSFTSTSLAGALAKTGDVYDQQIQVSQTGASAIVQSWVTTVANQTWTAPPALAGATSTVPTTAPYPRIKTTWTAYTNAVGYDWSATQALSGTACGSAGGNCSVQWATHLSAGVAGTAPSTEMPDLSMLAGWDPKLEMQTGTSVNGSLRAVSSSAGLADFPVHDPAPAGTHRKLVTSAWTVTP